MMMEDASESMDTVEPPHLYGFRRLKKRCDGGCRLVATTPQKFISVSFASHFLLLVGAHYRLRAELSWRLACGNNDSAEFLLIVSRNSPSDTSERITQYGECNNKNILPLWKQRKEKQANFVLRRSPAKRKVVFYVYYYLEEELTRYPSF